MTQFVVKCEDGFQRHKEPFLNLIDAARWADQGHCCTNAHTFHPYQPTPDVQTFHLKGWSETPDSTTKAMLLGALIQMALPTISHYLSDFYHDALWINEHITATEVNYIGPPTEAQPYVFYYSYDECGTYVSLDAQIGLSRKHAFTCYLYQVRGMWQVDFKAVA